jgi:hypothetical protein
MSTYLSLKDLRKRLKSAHCELHSWRKVGALYGISSGLAYHIAIEGKEPHDPKIRHRLGLPAYAPAPCCVECGQVHVAKRCPNKRQDYTDLFAMPTNRLIKMLMEREPFT